MGVEVCGKGQKGLGNNWGAATRKGRLSFAFSTVKGEKRDGLMEHVWSLVSQTESKTRLTVLESLMPAFVRLVTKHNNLLVISLERAK